MTRRQILEAGYGKATIGRRLRAGRLHLVLPGVYLVGHRAAPALARECAAVLYCAPRAMLSHGTGVRLWRLGRRHRGPDATIDVTVVGRHRRSAPGLRVHSIEGIEPAELRRHEGIPITSPSLTLLDYAGYASTWALASALSEVRVRRMVSDEELDATLTAHPNRRGARALAELLRSEEAAFATESEAEARCLRLMIKHGLRPDAAGTRIGPYRVDFLYRVERLIVEVDGYRYHGHRERFVRDRRRIADLMAWGYEVFPLTWDDIAQEPAAAMDRLRRVLAERRARIAPTFPV